MSKIKQDCYAIDIKNVKNTTVYNCKCLKELYCKKEDCSFYVSNKNINWDNIEKEIASYIPPKI